MSPSTSDTLLSDQQQAITIKCSNDSSRVKVDFIRRIPTELLCTVLSHLDPNHLVTECLLVSQLWRERLLHCPKVWSQIRVDRMEFSPRALLLVGKYIQLLKVHHCGGRWFTMLFEYMIAGAFPKLRTLKLSPMGRYHIDQRVTEEGLRHLQGSLKTLCIECPAGTLLNLQSIFTSCPQLITLDFWHTAGLGIYDPLPYMASLTTLTVVQRTTVLSEEPLQRIVDACPNLQRLSLRLCEPSQMAFLVRSLPKLEILYFNNYGASAFAKDPITTDNQPTTIQDQQPVGLQHLVADAMHIPDLIEVLQTHCSTLETLVLDMTGSTGNEWSQIERLLERPLNMIKLHTLEYDAQYMDHGENVLEWLLAGCTALEKVQISRVYDTTNDDDDDETHNSHQSTILFQHLSRMSRLKYLSLQDIDNVDGLEEYARHLGSLGSACPLESLMLHECMLTDRHLNVLGKIRTLKNINILYPDDCISTTALNRFFSRHHHGSSVLARVKLFAVNCATRDTLAAIGKMPALESLLLYFHGGSRISKQDAVEFAVQHPHVNLKCFGRHFEESQ